jgi:hypothetical protein
MPLMHAAMDLIWQAYGFARCLHFQNGHYVGLS